MLDLSFFDDDPHTVARNLLGCMLVRTLDEDICSCRIVEVEVYGGVEDASSHANSGRPTKKTASMFDSPGTIYVYSIHRYFCLNVVTSATPDKPSAILIRAAEPLEGMHIMARHRNVDLNAPRGAQKLLSGPGKLCQALAIDRRYDELRYDSKALYFEEGITLPNHQVVCSKRVGLNPKTCGDSVHRPWRYLEQGSRYLSKKA